jgi:cobalt/nickel transport system permease protein
VPSAPTRNRSSSFIERTIVSFARATEHALFAEDIAKSRGLLQRLDPRVKVFGILALLIAAAMARNLKVIAALFAVAVVLALFSRVPLSFLLKRVWIAVLLFTGVIALPAPFVTPGRVLFSIPWLQWPVTQQGLMAAAYLIARVETAATFSALLVLCTPWSQVLKALRIFRVPVVVVTILSMTYRYIFLLLQTAREMFDAHRARTVGELTGAERRRMAAASAGVLMSKSFQLSTDVFSAMQSRGFRGDVYVLDEFKTQPFDWFMLSAALAVTAAAVWFGR